MSTWTRYRSVHAKLVSWENELALGFDLKPRMV